MPKRCATVVPGTLVVVAVVLLATHSVTKGGQAPTALQADGRGQPDGKKPAAPKKPLLILDERVDVTPFQAPMSLRDALATLEKDLSNRGMELDVIVDAEAFKAENPEAPDIFDTQVALPPGPKKLTVAMALRQMLNKVPTGNATYLVFRDHLLVTTLARSGIESLLLQKVAGVYENRPLGQLLRDLGEKTAVTIVVDKRVGDRENSPVSATFQRDITLAGALRAVAEQADLKVVLIDGVVYVTTPAHAELLRKEQKLQEKERHVLWPVGELLDPRPPEAPALTPGPGGIPVQPVVDPGLEQRMPTPVDAPPGYGRRKEAAARP
jgi:hypothetical protein